jgi:Do/DeqQ family serine protease
VTKVEFKLQTLSVFADKENKSLKQIRRFLVWFSTLIPLVVSTADAESLRRSAVVVAVEAVSPTVVNISTIIRERARPAFPFARDEFFRDFFPELFSREYSRTSLGSGVIIDGAKGYIVTNHHVVARATEIKVMTSDQKGFKAQVVGMAPRADLAVLQIESATRLPEVEMGRSDDLMIGETVIAIGNPFGLSHTVTTGVVSALNRSVRAEEHVFRNFIQTDASINPGNSGGPLLNLEGRLIGINTAIYQKAQGIGFAIPIDKVKLIVEELIQAGEVRIPWLGIEVQPLTPQLRTYFNVPGQAVGVLISDVLKSSPAAKGGITRGDILLVVAGIPVGSVAEYRDALTEFTVGERLDLGVLRAGQELTRSIEPSPFPLRLALDLVERRLGIEVVEMDRAAKRKYGDRGVLIKDVRRESEAGKIGLKRGDVLLKVNDILVTNLDDLKQAVAHARNLTALTLLVQRGNYGYSVTLPF